jgi:hypothetical protein
MKKILFEKDLNFYLIASYFIIFNDDKNWIIEIENKFYYYINMNYFYLILSIKILKYFENLRN